MRQLRRRQGKRRLEEKPGEKVTRVLRFFIKFVFYVKTVLSTLSFYSKVTTNFAPTVVGEVHRCSDEILAVLGSMKQKKLIFKSGKLERLMGLKAVNRLSLRNNR